MTLSFEMLIASLNVRGLGKIFKRSHIFGTLYKNHISCLQECYITEDNAKLIASDWKGKFYFQYGSSHSKGLIILVSDNFEINNLKEIKIDDRCLGVSFEYLSNFYIVFNIYAPSAKEERIPFFENLKDTLKINNLPSDSTVIICGDMNTYRDEYLDNIKGLPHGKGEIDSFNRFLYKNNLIDCFRHFNPKNKDFSWISIRYITDTDHNNPPTICARRLDYILCNRELAKNLKSCKMEHVSFCDHKMVTALFTLDPFPRGPGRWQLNESLLDNDNFVSHLNSFIFNLYEELKTNEFLDKRLLWDVMKISIKEEIISFSRNEKMKLLNSQESNCNLTHLNELLILNPNDESLIKKIHKILVNKEIEELSKARGALKRAKIKNIEEMEKNSKLFLGLEKSRQSHTTIRTVFDNKEELIDTPGEILKVISDFYSNLLNPNESSRKIDLEDLNTFLENIDHPILNNNDKDRLDNPLLMQEFKDAILHLNCDSSPGIDGFSPSFFTKFWDVLKIPFYNSIMEATEYKEMSLSQRRAILSLLPKDSSLDLNYLGNWRPISLLCTDMKIFSRVLAVRMQSVIHKLVHSNQCGYIRNRSISDHHRLIDDVLRFCESENVSGLLVSLDFRKAFDTVSKSCIIAVLKKFNFGPNFIGFVETTLNNTETCIKNAGWLSSFFPTGRGVRQGCILSPLLFILVVELLAIKVRADKQIVGLLDSVPHCPTDEVLKSLQYADDMELFLKDKASLVRTFVIVEEFKFISDLGLNIKKCLAMALGSFDIESLSSLGITLLGPNDSLKILGIFFKASEEASLIENNHSTKISEIQNIIKNWSRRKFSVMGNCTVTKTFMLSQVTNIIQALSLPSKILEIIDKMLFQFLWGNGDQNKKVPEKVRRSTVCLPIEEGGLGMISVQDQQQVMLISWIRKGMNCENSTQRKLIDYFLKDVGGLKYIYRSDLNIKTFREIKSIKSTFWKEVVTSWLKLDKSAFDNISHDTPLFNCSHFLFKKKPIYIRKWVLSGLVFCHQMYVNGQMKSVEEVGEMVGKYNNLLFDYFAVKSALINSKVTVLNESAESDSDFEDILKLDNKNLRNMIVRNKQENTTLNCEVFWKSKYDIDVRFFFNTAKLATKETKLKVLHFKILHNIFPTNSSLFKMNIVTSPICKNCTSIENLEHLFYTCEKLTSFWSIIEDLSELIFDRRIKLSPAKVLLGLSKIDQHGNKRQTNEFNCLLLIAKQSIVKYKFSNEFSLIFIFKHELSLRTKSLPSLEDLFSSG